MLQDLVNKKVVIDLRGPYVCLGTLMHVGDHWLELRNADLHDLRDTQTSRETYVAESKATGIKRNRKRLMLMRAEMIAIALLDDVVAE